MSAFGEFEDMSESGKWSTAMLDSHALLPVIISDSNSLSNYSVSVMQGIRFCPFSLAHIQTRVLGMSRKYVC